jgi:hypothetical protein
MAAETEVKIQVDVDGTRKLDRLERKIRSLERTVDKLGAKSTRVFKNYGSQMENTLGKSAGKWKRHFDDLDTVIKKFGTATLGGLKLAMKAAGAEMALMAISMVSLHGLFKIGQGLVKTYTGLLNVLGGAAAGATLALAGTAAALREQNAAMFAFRGNAMAGYDGFVTGLNKVRVVMRGLHRDQTLASAGAANLEAAYAAVSQRSTFSTGSQSMLRQLMDFASAGGDMKKGMSSAGELIASIQSGKGNWREQAKSMGEPMKQAMKDLGITSREQLQAALSDGSLAAAGGVTGQWKAVSGTLIGQFKSAFTGIRADFADLGQSFLGPLKVRLEEVTRVFRDSMSKVWLPLMEFGNGPFLASITGFAEKATDMFVSLVRRGPEVEGMFGRIADRWKGFVDGWNNVLDRLRPMIDGARVLEGMFGNMFGAIGDYIRESFGFFNEMLQENESGVREFGTRLGELFSSFGNFQHELKALFFEALPFINRIIGGVKSIVDMLTNVISGGRGMLGAVGDGAGAYGLLAAAMVILSKLKMWAGGFLFMKQTQTMNVTAGQVNVAGGGAGATGVTGQGQLNAGNRAALNAQGMKSMSFRQRVGSEQLAAGKTGTMWQRQVGSRLRAARQPSEAFRGKLAGSMGARVGLGMGLGMLSSRVGEESQGVMALGGAAAFMSPQIGAGIAGLGLAATSQNQTHSALGGAAGGAAIGLYAGPWGALGGAIIGGAYGWLTAGARKSAAARGLAQEAGRAISDAMIDAIASQLKVNVEGRGGSALTTRSVKQTMADSAAGGYRDDLFDAALSGDTGQQAAIINRLQNDPAFAHMIEPGLKEEDYGSLVAALAVQLSNDLGKIDTVIDRTAINLGVLGDAFNMGEESILAMAGATNTELYSATAGWGALAISLSGALINDTRELQAASADRRVAIQQGMRDAIERIDAPHTLDEASQNIRNILKKDGPLSDDDQQTVLTEFGNVFQAMTTLTGSETAGSRQMQSLFGPGGLVFGEGQMLGGMESKFRSIDGVQGALAGNDRSAALQKFDAAEIIFSSILGAGVSGSSLSGVYSQLGDMRGIEGSGLLERDFYRDTDTGAFLTAAVLKDRLAELGINLDLAQMTKEDLMAPQDKFEGAVASFIGGVTDLVTAIDVWRAPTDTSTPRRGVVAMRGRLQGGLGSSNSDHLYGGAFDQSGSNLGSVMTGIRNAGGYADMHGSGRTRHLHGVPSTAQSGGGESNNYTINVVGGDNASPAEIADEVMDRIARRSVDTYERA